MDSFQLVYSFQSGGNRCLFQGVKFDPQSGSALHIEMARSNSRRKRKPGMKFFIVFQDVSKVYPPKNTCYLWLFASTTLLRRWVSVSLLTGSGAYVVIDNRNKAVGDAQESSGDGNMFCNTN